MKRYKGTIISLIVLVVVLGLAVLGGMFLLRTESINLKMFGELSEFAKLEQIATKELVHEDNPDAQGLSEKEAYGCEADYEGCTYEVYAYVFEDEDGARQYFENVTGKETQEAWNFSCSGNVFFRTRYVIYSGNCAYMVKGNAYRPCARFINWLNADFSQELNFKT